MEHLLMMAPPGCVLGLSRPAKYGLKQRK